MGKPDVHYIKVQALFGRNNATVGPSQIYAVPKSVQNRDPHKVGTDLNDAFYQRHGHFGDMDEINPGPASVLTVAEIDHTQPLAVQLIEQGLGHLTLQDIAIYLHSENYIQDI